ncbi:MAG TPA: ATP-dependent DNA helicase RecG [Pseudogracilibacillus sp.]|nr:ATP-dependent DNA helicase RecG [Pseudogracilibacillus sp.]
MLTAQVTTIKGVGEKVAQDLAEMNIYTVQDLIYYFPYRYDVHEIKPVSELIHDDQVTVIGQVIYDPTVSYFGHRKSRLMFTVNVEGVAIKAVMFNRAFAKKQLPAGTDVTLTGKWDAHRLQITVSEYKLGVTNDDSEIKTYYSVKGKLSAYRLKLLIKEAIQLYETKIIETLPETYIRKYKLATLNEALIWIHFPTSTLHLKQAKRRFIYEELLLFQIKMQLLRKKSRESDIGEGITFEQEKIDAFIKSLPYQLTHAQQRSLNEIYDDLKSPYRMNRLLQGDVGSGKTVIAALALYAVYCSGKQGALMVPTEILAEQHYTSLKRMFHNKLKIGLLTGSTTAKERREILALLRSGEINILLGTHALIQQGVDFKNLGLVIIDEQHRFGVEQRRILREKGLHPDTLFMTATPIPRTLSITAFGDMDISIIDELPQGRKETETFWVKENMLERILIFIKKRIDQGEQAFVVSPLIEESENFDYQNAIDLFNQLRTYYPQDVGIGLLHGRLKQEEKDSIMNQFIKNEIQIIVATTVIEVGVNVPNATVMLIYNAERFGLSQLHQLRGRVGRGDKQSYCILIAEPKGEIGKERMKIMTETNDGFKLSEKDLKLRGPGDVLGKKQSGIPEFKLADIVHDYRTLETARVDAIEIVENDLLKKNSEFKQLAQIIENDHLLKTKLD